MYSRETALNFGLDLFSTGGDFQLGGGVSQTDWVWIIIE